MAGRTHIVGAGIAGLSAALAASAQGHEVVLYEAAPRAGGRCRTLYPDHGFRHDNGTHVLFTANRCALDLLKVIGARDRWIEPEAGGLPLYDAHTGRMDRIGLSPWSWLDPTRRPAGLCLEDIAGILRLAFCWEDRAVGAILGPGSAMDRVIEPLTVAVLNTPVAIASSRRLGLALRRLLRPGSSRLLVARNGLSEDLVEPALETLRGRGSAILTGQRLKSVRIRDGHVVGLISTDRLAVLGPDDQVILALPPWEIARLIPSLSVPDRFEPILNVHYRVQGGDLPRFAGLIGTVAQWVLVRRDHVSVTVSAAGAVIDRESGGLGVQIWHEIVPALRALGLDVAVDCQPETRVVKEKRATIRQASGLVPQPLLRPFANLTLAGDWLGDFPATIENAVMAGERAVCLLGRPPLRRLPVQGHQPLQAGGTTA